MIFENRERQCSCCGWVTQSNFRLETHRQQYQPGEFQQLYNVGSTKSSTHGETIGDKTPDIIDAEVGELDIDEDELLKRKQEDSDPEDDNSHKLIENDVTKKAYQKDKKISQPNFRKKHVRLKQKIKSKRGRPWKEKSQKLNDFNKYIIRKLRYYYSQNFDRNHAYNGNLDRVIELCGKVRVVNFLNLLIPFLKRKHEDISIDQEFPFDRDKLGQNKALIYSRQSQDLLQILNEEA